MNDNDVTGLGHIQDYGMRTYDGLQPRFWSVDPLTSKYPGWSPYVFAMDRPVDGVDQDGLEYSPAANNGNPRDATAVQSGINPDAVLKRMMDKNKAKQPSSPVVINSPNATLSQGPAAGTWGANESDRLKQQYETRKEMSARADLDPVGFGAANSMLTAGKEYVEGTINHGYGIYEGIQDKNAGQIAGNTIGLALDVAPFFVKGGGTGLSRLETKIVNESSAILNAKEFTVIRNAYEQGISAEVKIGNRTIQYEPGWTYSEAMTLHGENGFLLGPKAFVSAEETGKTVIHEMYRLFTQKSMSLGVSETKQFTDGALQASNKLYPHLKLK
jgi:hypothetical protein